jgi:hypothetical protein
MRQQPLAKNADAVPHIFVCFMLSHIFGRRVTFSSMVATNGFQWVMLHQTRPRNICCMLLQGWVNPTAGCRYADACLCLPGAAACGQNFCQRVRF